MGLIDFVKDAGEKLFGRGQAHAAPKETAAEAPNQASTQAANSAAADAIQDYIKSQNLSATGLTVTYDGATSTVTVEPFQRCVNALLRVPSMTSDSGPPLTGMFVAWTGVGLGPGGIVNTSITSPSTGQISCTMLTLLEHPEMLAALRADPALVPLAVEETMRYVSTIGAVPRVAIEAVDFDGLHFEPGALLFLCTDTANHDPIGYAEPGRFLPSRFEADDVHRLMTFGAGPHYCLGAAFARMVVQEAVAAVLRLPEPLRLAEPVADLEWTTVLATYPARIPITCGG